MSFMGFNEKGTRDIVLQNVINNSNYIGLFFLGACFFCLSFFYIFPDDLFTSALFFDGLELQQTFTSSSSVFSEGGVWEQLPDVTTGSFAFAASLALTQVFFGYKSAVSKGSLYKPLVSLWNEKKFVNTTKLGWFLAYVFVAAFDTWTDVEYRSFFGQSGLYFKATLVSFFYYNLFSEYALVQGGKLMLNYGFVLKQALSKGLGKESVAAPPQNNQRQKRQNKNQKNKNSSKQNKNNQSGRNGRNGRSPQSAQVADLPPDVAMAIRDIESSVPDSRSGIRRVG